MTKELTANALKEILWKSLQTLEAGDETNLERVNSMATQAREILRTVKVQLQIAKQTNRDIGSDLINFSEAK